MGCGWRAGPSCTKIMIDDCYIRSTKGVSYCCDMDFLIYTQSVKNSCVPDFCVRYFLMTDTVWAVCNVPFILWPVIALRNDCEINLAEYVFYNMMEGLCCLARFWIFFLRHSVMWFSRQPIVKTHFPVLRSDGTIWYEFSSCFIIDFLIVSTCVSSWMQ